MKQRRVTTDELLDTADHIARLWQRAKELGQYTVSEPLEKMVFAIREVAKSTALSEADDRRKLAKMSTQEGGGENG